MSNSVIPESELRHTVIITERTAAASPDAYGQTVYTTADKTYHCHFEFISVTEVREKEEQTTFDVLLVMLPSVTAKKGDRVKKITSHDGAIVYDSAILTGDPLVIAKVERIPFDEGVHHVEAYASFRNPRT